MDCVVIAEFQFWIFLNFRLLGYNSFYYFNFITLYIYLFIICLL